MFTIYLIRCLVNNKPYIGQTSRLMEARFQEHIKHADSGKTNCRKLYAAMRKYGSSNFSVEKLFEAETKLEADSLEIASIKNFDSIKKGYNLQIGGYNGQPSEETRKLMSLAKLGEKNNRYGKTHTQLTKDIISIKMTGKPGYWKGKSLYKETRDKLSSSLKGKYTGENNPSAKLTSEEVDQIKSLLQDLNYTRQKIADMFGVSLSTIKRIKAGKAWK